MGEIKYQLGVNNELITSVVNLKEISTSSIINKCISLYFEKNNEELKLAIKNIGSESIVLNKLNLELFSTRDYKKTDIVINPKTVYEKISSVHIDKVSEGERIESYLFETLIDNENNNSRFFGFLGSRYSKNTIENVLNKNELHAEAVYNFIRYELKPEEELRLDSLYIAEGQDIFSLFNSFMDKMLIYTDLRSNNNMKAKLEDSNAYSILYTYKVNSSTLKIDNKPVYVKVNKKKLYAVDISTEEGRNKVFSNANAVISKVNLLDINGIGQYISIIEENKLFNAHYELYKLLTFIKSQLEKNGFFSNDYALGLLNSKVTVENRIFEFEEHKGLFSQLTKKDNNYINYDFFFKLLMQRIITYSYKSFSSNNKKINELMTVILTGANINFLANKNLLTMALDIGNNFTVIPYVGRSKIFGLLLTGAENMYLAVFNFDNKSTKFYCDLESQSYFQEADGVATEVYSDNDYLISDGKLYIRNVPSMDCCLFKKALNKTA
ncbi:hypothetical protein [Candidatus Clostridium stratigraminis]|uniref:Uncharacterized protein n=1 Tax=Candidatus Clostridium stratigraminis TaxID=3381661 RepID=A0ABW8T1H7_9CLOT